MSIRLRFTLLYNVILAVTLLVIGSVLYSVQAQSTLQALKQDLMRTARGVGQALVMRVGQAPRPAEEPRQQPQPVPFAMLSDDELRSLPEREIVRVLDASGGLLLSPFGSSQDALPLTEEGLRRAQAGLEVWETHRENEQRLLVYTLPITRQDGNQYILQVARSLAERDRTLDALGHMLVTIEIATLVVAFGIGWALSGITFRPIKRMTQTARDIGEQRDFTRRVAYNGPQDEVGQLANTFNRMLEQLQAAYQRVAQALDLQRTFVADISHELRTPLTTLRGNLGLLRRVPAIPARERLEVLTDMESESDRMIRLVNDLLTLARAESGRSYARVPLEAVPLIEDICRRQQALYPNRRIRHTAEPGLVMLGDRDALQQVLLIALDNALKHTEGDVLVNAHRVEDAVEIRVRDYGPGIEPEHLAHIFDRFYRGELGGAPGYGLGLAIARSLMEGQGGHIKMESISGEGSTLVLRMPAAGAASGEADVPGGTSSPAAS